MKKKILKVLFGGGSIKFSITGTTFPCYNGDFIERQEVLAYVKRTTDEGKTLPLVFVKEPDNKYDTNAIRDELTDKSDIGYIPQKDVTVSFLSREGKAVSHTVSCLGLNSILQQVSITGELLRVTGGVDGLSRGGVVRVWLQEW